MHNGHEGQKGEQVGREQRRGSDALAVLGRHGDDEPPDAPLRKGLQHTVVDPVEGLQLEKGIDRLSKVGKGRRGDRRYGSGGKHGGNSGRRRSRG